MESNITSATSSGIPPGFGCRSRTSFLGKTCICRSDFLSPVDVLTSTRMKSASTDTFPKKASEDAKENIFNVGSNKRPTFLLVFVGASRDYTSAWWSTTNSCGAFDKHSYHPILAMHRPLLVLKALANENTLLPTQMFPRLPARATFVADTKMFLILFRNILCPQQMFLSLRSPRSIMSNNVSATVCPRLPVPLGTVINISSFQVFSSLYLAFVLRA